MKDTVQVQEYSLASYVKAIQDAVQQGYAIDFESNEGYPSQFGTVFVVSLKKQAQVGTQVPEQDLAQKRKQKQS